MMETLFTGEAPLAGCITGRVRVAPFDCRAAAELLRFRDPVDSLLAYGVLGGVPLYLSFFSPERTLRENLLAAVITSSSRLYVEPAAVFAAHHASFSAENAMRVLRAIANRHHQWSDILQASGLANAASLGQVLDRLIGELGLVERVLPVTESAQSRAYRPQYRLTDNFFRFWFRYVEPNQGHIEFGDAETVVDMILASLDEFMGPVLEGIARDWTRAASAAGVLPIRLARVGSWWSAAHEVDVVGLDDTNQVAFIGECKWSRARFGDRELRTYLGHVAGLAAAAPTRPDVIHTLFCRSGFDDNVRQWATNHGAMLIGPADLVAPFPTLTADDINEEPDRDTDRAG
jgi:AAA+ ATPase superfamily predicted ATPase